MKFHRVFVSSVSIVLAVFTTGSCGQSVQDSTAEKSQDTATESRMNPNPRGEQRMSFEPPKVVLPNDTVMYVTINGRAELRYFSRNGEEIKESCELCKDMKSCRDPSLKERFCQGTVNTSIQEIQQLSIIKHLGSSCTTTSSGGFNAVTCVGCPLPVGHPLSHLCQ